MEHLTKTTQNRWGSVLVKEFDRLFKSYLSMHQDLLDNQDYRKLCWRFAYDTIEMLHEMKRENAAKVAA